MAPTLSNRNSSRSPQSWFIDPAALMQVKSTNLRAKSVVEGFTAGLHRSPLRGFSVEFAEYRPYSLGDDLRNLDWKLVARTDRYYVKQFEDETNRRCYLALDQSRSMQYGSGEYTKAEYARTLAATLAYYLTQQRDAVGLMTCGVETSEYLPPRGKSSHLQQIMRILDQESQGSDSDLSGALTELASLSRRRGLVILISDLLTEPASLAKPLGYLRGRGHEVIVLRILDSSEIAFSLEQASMLRDLESGRELFVDPETAAADYKRRFEEHEAELLDVAHRNNARFVTVNTREPLESVMLSLVTSRTSSTAQGRS